MQVYGIKQTVDIEGWDLNDKKASRRIEPRIIENVLLAYQNSDPTTQRSRKEDTGTNMSIKVSSERDNATTMHDLKKLSDKRVQVSSFRQDSDLSSLDIDVLVEDW
ncbi:4099_t:CDS:2 [Rhizophagus irregularis]|nr:4099_t:CDS:2 [Rhizophagus irregularis]